MGGCFGSALSLLRRLAGAVPPGRAEGCPRPGLLAYPGQFGPGRVEVPLGALGLSEGRPGGVTAAVGAETEEMT